MKLVALKVLVADHPSSPKAKLEQGEHIVKRVIELDSLNDELKGEFHAYCVCFLRLLMILPAYEARGFTVDARLAHFASGWELANKFNKR